MTPQKNPPWDITAIAQPDGTKFETTLTFTLDDEGKIFSVFELAPYLEGQLKAQQLNMEGYWGSTDLALKQEFERFYYGGPDLSRPLDDVLAEVDDHASSVVGPVRG